MLIHLLAVVFQVSTGPICTLLNKSMQINIAKNMNIMHLLDLFFGYVTCYHLSVCGQIIDEGQGWESPREPYEVKAR